MRLVTDVYLLSAAFRLMYSTRLINFVNVPNFNWVMHFRIWLQQNMMQLRKT